MTLVCMGSAVQFLHDKVVLITCRVANPAILQELSGNIS